MSEITILIVENEAIVAADLSGKLRRLGYKVDGIAAGGEEAVEMAGRLYPQLVLMDIRLEGSMDGIEAAERIRLKHDVPVIYLTAHSDSATLARAKLTGPFGYILKPFEERELATQIELALFRHNADQEIRAQRRALREANERYELVLTGSEAGIWDWDVTRHKVVFSARWKAMRGLSDHEVSDAEEEWSQGIHPEDAPRVMASVQAHFEGKTSIFSEEYRVRRKDGSWMWIADRGLARRDSNGQVVRMAGSETDITERKRVEEALKESERKYRELVRYAPTAIYEVDFRSRRFTSVNDAMCHMVGYGREELLAMNPFDLTDEEGKSRFHARIAQWIKGNEPDRNAEYRIKAKDGHILDVVLDVTFTVDGKGELIGATVVGHDITERKQMEEALRKSRDELEQRVRERTVELETYMRRLQESNQALQDFASIASHDMQEPLRKVISFGKMLKQSHSDSLRDEGKDYLDRMLNATERLQTLLKSLLDYSRVTSQAEPFRKVDLATIVGEVLSDLEVRVKRSGGEVRVSDLPTVEADPIQMRQLFQNLIGNALKFHKEGEKPQVEVRGTSLGDGMTEIVVKDNGIGFDEKYLERIFMPFQRLHGRGEFEGTGIGLAICRKIVGRHGGTITATSAPGRGSTFTMTLSKKQIRPKTES